MSRGGDLLDRFYAAFSARDADTMAACYSPAARFSDPVYPDLQGPEIGAMWRMLTARAQELTLQVEQTSADDHSGTASSTWVASYLFGPDRRPVTNRVSSRFQLDGGLIRVQRDDFDLHSWSAMALGVRGRLLGWTPLVRDRVRREAADQLRAFMAAQGTAQSSA
jgi:hypothetical protein